MYYDNGMIIFMFGMLCGILIIFAGEITLKLVSKIMDKKVNKNEKD